MANYIKRMLKYVVYDFKQPIVKTDVVQKTPDKEFKGKKYLVTGGGSGIGFEIVKKLVKNGAFCIITGRNEDKMKNVVKKIGNNKCDYIVCDISDIGGMRDKFEKVIEKYGAIDGLINNAGVSLHEWDFLKVTPEGFDMQFYTNLKGSFFLTQSYIRSCLKSNMAGNVIFISSERGSMAECIPYGLTKASINSLVRGLSYKYYKSNVRVNAVAPGVTATAMTKKSKDDDLYSESTSGRVFLPEEVAETCAFLLSDYSKCISGEVVHCNGGNHIKFGW